MLFQANILNFMLRNFPDHSRFMLSYVVSNFFLTSVHSPFTYRGKPVICAETQYAFHLWRAHLYDSLQENYVTRSERCSCVRPLLPLQLISRKLTTFLQSLIREIPRLHKAVNCADLWKCFKMDSVTLSCESISQRLRADKNRSTKSERTTDLII